MTSWVLTREQRAALRRELLTMIEAAKKNRAVLRYADLSRKYGVSPAYISQVKKRLIGGQDDIKSLRWESADFIAPVAHRPAVMPKVVAGITMARLMAGR